MKEKKQTNQAEKIEKRLIEAEKIRSKHDPSGGGYASELSYAQQFAKTDTFKAFGIVYDLAFYRGWKQGVKHRDQEDQTEDPALASIAFQLEAEIEQQIIIADIMDDILTSSGASGMLPAPLHRKLDYLSNEIRNSLSVLDQLAGKLDKNDDPISDK